MHSDLLRLDCPAAGGGIGAGLMASAYGTLDK